MPRANGICCPQKDDSDDDELAIEPSSQLPVMSQVQQAAAEFDVWMSDSQTLVSMLQSTPENNKKVYEAVIKSTLCRLTDKAEKLLGQGSLTISANGKEKKRAHVIPLF